MKVSWISCSIIISKGPFHESLIGNQGCLGWWKKNNFQISFKKPSWNLPICKKNLWLNFSQFGEKLEVANKLESFNGKIPIDRKFIIDFFIGTFLESAPKEIQMFFSFCITLGMLLLNRQIHISIVIVLVKSALHLMN